MTRGVTSEYASTTAAPEVFSRWTDTKEALIINLYPNFKHHFF